KTSAENVANYSLGSEGAIDGARRLDAPEDDRVVLQIRNGQPDGFSEAITVSGVRSLADGAPMPAPQTLHFVNGVLELDKVDDPDPGALAGEGCDDRSRFLTPDDSPDNRVSFTGTVTGVFGDDYTLQDGPNPRAGLWVHQPGASLVLGHAYRLAGILRDI